MAETENVRASQCSTSVTDEMNSLTSLEEQNMRLMMQPSLNDLELLPCVYKAFFDLIKSEFADREAKSAPGKKRSQCGCDALLNTAVTSVTHLGTG